MKQAGADIVGSVVFVQPPEKRHEKPKESTLHAGFQEPGWNRDDRRSVPKFQRVNLLAREALEEIGAHQGLKVWPGFCGENICTESVDYDSLSVGSLLQVGGTILLVTEKGKMCEGKCMVSQVSQGQCPLSNNWLFTWLISGSEVHIGDPVRIINPTDAPEPRPSQ